MNRHIALGCLVVTGLGCSVVAPRAKADPIVMNSHYNLDYARVACEQAVTSGYAAGAAECNSMGDKRELGRRLENRVVDALAAEPGCAGVTVIRDPRPNSDRGRRSEADDQSKQKKPFWDLKIDYEPGEKAFGWTLFLFAPDANTAGPFFSGEGIPAKAAKRICKLASGRDPTIR